MQQKEMDYIRKLFEEYRDFVSKEHKEFSDNLNDFKLDNTQKLTSMSNDITHLKGRMDKHNGEMAY
jgi:hypothetical protein